MDFFNRLKELVRDRETTIEDFLTAFDISRDTYNTWRKRGIYPRADQATAIARALNTTVEYLVTGEKPVNLSGEELAFHQRALKYRALIDSLDAADESARSLIVAGAMKQVEVSQEKAAEEAEDSKEIS